MLRIYSPRRGAETRRPRSVTAGLRGDVPHAHVEGTLAPVSRPAAPTSSRSSSTARAPRNDSSSRAGPAGHAAWQTPVRRLDRGSRVYLVSEEETAQATDAAQRHEIRLGQRSRMSPKALAPMSPGLRTIRATGFAAPSAG